MFSIKMSEILIWVFFLWGTKLDCQNIVRDQNGFSHKLKRKYWAILIFFGKIGIEPVKV
jgi:hypothetical protein